MDPETRKLLEEVHALARDNHRLLRSVRRHQILETFGRYLLWIIVILVSYVSYVSYIQPFMQKFRADPQGAAQSFFGLPTSSDVQNLINSYKPAQ